jgi:hypothetical protein
MKDVIRKCVIAAAAAVILVAIPQPAAAEEGKPFVNGTFRIVVLATFGEFAGQTQKTDGENGVIETTNYVSKAPTGEAIVVTMSKMPATILDPQKMIDSTKDSLLKSLGATVEKEDRIEGSRAETALLFRNDSAPVFLRSRLLVEDDRFYQILYVGRTEEQRASSAIGSVFTSFEIVAPAESGGADTVQPQTGN